MKNQICNISVLRGQILYKEAFTKEGDFFGNQKEIVIVRIFEDEFRPIEAIVSADLPLEATHDQAVTILKEAISLDQWHDTSTFQKWVNTHF